MTVSPNVTTNFNPTDNVFTPHQKKNFHKLLNKQYNMGVDTNQRKYNNSKRSKSEVRGTKTSNDANNIHAFSNSRSRNYFLQRRQDL